MPRVFLPGNPPRFQPGSNSFSLYFIGTSCGVWTAGGNGNGGCCVFPFNYHGIKYFTCTYQDHSNPWCAISSDFDHDGVWGECIGNKAIFGSWEEAQSPTNSLRFSLYRLWGEFMNKARIYLTIIPRARRGYEGERNLF